MNLFSTFIQTLSSIITNPIYRALLLSTTDMENGQMKYPMLELCNLLEWDQRTMAMNLLTRMEIEDQLAK